jgi:beta-lactamase superfamily II metal-dependent hydrolase
LRLLLQPATFQVNLAKPTSMFKLHAIQARFGDCFLLEYGEPKAEYILIDGGPSRNYDDHLKPALNDLLKGHETLEAIIISHVDNDHIMGILDLLVNLKYQEDTGKTPFLNIGQLWFNSFKTTIDQGDLENRIRSINTIAGANGIKMQEMSMAFNGIRQGNQLLTLARVLQIPVNPDAENGYYLATKNRQIFKRPGLDITVVGPTLRNLRALQKEWEEWIRKNEQKIQEGKYTIEFAAMSDRSIPNLSSIVLLLQLDGKTILLTGDCRGDHLQQGLIETGLSEDGSYHVDIFKVPHHGSSRNITKQFFQQITADVYVISADGTYGNPDNDTLYWIVETSHEAGRRIKLVLTNETSSTGSLLEKYDPEEWDYEIHFLKKGENSLVIS